jgi:hypothetical protein
MLHVTMSGGGMGEGGGGGAFSLSKVHIMTYLDFLFCCRQGLLRAKFNFFLNLEKVQRF